MSNLNHENFIEQLAENLAEELGRDPTRKEVEAEAAKRDFEIE